MTTQHRKRHEPVNAENDARAARLRSEGLTYRQIAEHEGVDPMTAHRRVQNAIKAIPAEAVEALRAVEHERLDAMWKVAWEQLHTDHLLIQNGKVVWLDPDHPVIDQGAKLAALDRLLRIQERRARLDGLDAPVRARVEVVTEDLLDAEIRRLEAELADEDHRVPGEAPAGS